LLDRARSTWRQLEFCSRSSRDRHSCGDRSPPGVATRRTTGLKAEKILSFGFSPVFTLLG
ncbi:MAG: hypothetical protein WBA24_08505, partial [Geitlerinemataceae cyanobacterium]